MTKELDDKTVFNDKTGSNPRIDLNGGSKMRDLNTGDENSAAVSCGGNDGGVHNGDAPAAPATGEMPESVTVMR